MRANERGERHVWLAPDVVDRQSVISSYICVAKKNLVAVAEMSNQARSVGAAIRAVADEIAPITPTLADPPRVGLVIFGFDADQKKAGGIGASHFEKLKDQLGHEFVRMRGDADRWKLWKVK